MSTVIKVEDLSKQYRLGQVGTGTMRNDLSRWWHKVRGKEDPFLKIGEENDRTKKGSTEFVWALKDINFSVKDGEVLGIIGRNGAGKSTLLKILSRTTAPTTGSVKIKGRIASLLEVGTGFHPELSGRQNVYLNGAILGMTRAEIKSKFDEIVDFAGVERYIDTPVKRYSSGMYVRLAFGVAAHLEPEILIVDEVLAVGDAEFQSKCLGKMKDVSRNEGRTVLFVSHQLASIQSLCSKVAYMKNGKMEHIGQTKEIINLYLSDKINKTNYKEYNNYLKWVSIAQSGEKIILTAEYACKAGLTIPHLGFVIYNNVGSPLFGSNPTLENIIFNRSKKYINGSITVEIFEPKLIDGEYNVAIWFGDDKSNYLEDEEALTFEVARMTTNKQYNQSLIGNIVPKTTWVIT